jgi:NAD(P)H-hydrate repair Nnr-like enzyme with NAD(P)H-hydrate dehydratase domain
VLAALSALFMSYGRATAGSSTISDEPLLKHSAMIGLWNACATVRTAAQLAFAENGRATTTTDIIDKLHPAML